MFIKRGPEFINKTEYMGRSLLFVCLYVVLFVGSECNQAIEQSATWMAGEGT